MVWDGSEQRFQHLPTHLELLCFRRIPSRPFKTWSWKVSLLRIRQQVCGRLAERLRSFVTILIDGLLCRVPMLISGPGISAGSTPTFAAGNVDLAPTFLALAGVTKPVQMDGRSILPVLLQNKTTERWRTMYPIEYSGLLGWPKDGGRINDCPNNTYRSMRILDPTTKENAIFSEYTTGRLNCVLSSSFVHRQAHSTIVTLHSLRLFLR